MKPKYYDALLKADKEFQGKEADRFNFLCEVIPKEITDEQEAMYLVSDYMDFRELEIALSEKDILVAEGLHTLLAMHEEFLSLCIDLTKSILDLIKNEDVVKMTKELKKRLRTYKDKK